MLRRFFPDHYYNSIFEIDLAHLKADGIKGIIFDLDNTIIARNSSTATEELKHWLNRLKKENFCACILSNNWKQRVSTVASQVELPLVARAAKPRKKAFKKALDVLGTGRHETAVVGDQIFTDVFGGNVTGLRTILVMPMSNHDAIHTKFLRYLERWIMNRWQKHRLQVEAKGPY